MRHSRAFKILLTLGLLLIQASSAYSISTKEWLKARYEVKSVLAGDRFAIDFKGLNLVMKLVFVDVKDGPASKKELSRLLSGKSVIILPEENMGLSPEGLQQVYAFAVEDGTKIFVNKSMLSGGSTKFSGGEAKFEKFFKILKKASASVAPEYRELTGGFCSELNSKRYHKLSCKWAKQMNQQNRIIYESFGAAEKAKKSPCSLCLYERVKDLRSIGGQKNIGKFSKKGLLGIRGDHKFYSPVSKKILKAKASDLLYFSSLKEAQKSGRKPDLGSLRLDNPVVPGPRGNECIGRSLPYYRPCKRTSEHPTRLCEPCLNGRVR